MEQVKPALGLPQILNDSILLQLRTSLGQRVKRAIRCSGGDLSQSFQIWLEDESPRFLKFVLSPPDKLFLREAEGLRWLGESTSIQTPEVIACYDGPSFGFLVLQWIPQTRPDPGFDRKLGYALARLHLLGADHFGWHSDNYLGPIIQDNSKCQSWAEFYTTRRLLPLINQLSDSHSLPKPVHLQLDRVIGKIPELAGESESPSRLHGDLWSGNILCSQEQNICLIDPAVYGGDREIDLAMLQLFGSPSQKLYTAYDEVYPRRTGHESRLALYQLYPLLVHVKLFGSSYLSSLANCLRSCLI